LDYRAQLAETSNHLGSFHFDRGELPAAAEHFRRAVAHAERLAEDYPEQIRFQELLAASSANLGIVYGATDQLELAEHLLLRAEKLRNQLAKDAFHGEAQAASLAGVWRELASLEAKTDRIAQAEAHLRLAVDAFDKLTRQQPAVPRYAELHGLSRRELADLLSKGQRY
jgi:tetratricopeptide (TPR) repeat protein